jgi:NDP-sugar pyrophosphorylase family protein
MNEPNIVILAGGISSRMKKASGDVPEVHPLLLEEAQKKPKAMMSIGAHARPFLDYLLESIERAGYRDVVIVVSEKDASIRSHYETKRGNNKFPGLRMSYAIQNIPQGRSKPLGTADALLVALQSKPEWRGTQFTVCNSDNLYSINVLSLLLNDPHGNAMIDYDRSSLQFDKKRIAQFAVIKKDDDGFLSDIIEKPSNDEMEQVKNSSNRIGVSMNIFRFSYNMIFPFLIQVPVHPVRHEKELPLAVRMMAREQRKSIWTIPVAEHVIDLTNQSDIPIVQAYLQKEFKEFD